VAESERTFLGLTHNPFVEPFSGFFERGGRKTNLEQLRHLSQWSRRVLLVTGAEGVGKTTLYRELAATLEPRVKAARINGSLVNTGFEVLSAIAQGFGLAIQSDANTQSLRLDLIEHVEKQSGEDRLCLTLVDDAHLLDNKAVESLIALTHDSAMHLVLFGEVRMVPGIERAASLRGVGWQEIRLTGYADADAREYLEWRFSQARYRGRVPFTDNEVRDLIRLSEGLPGRINQMANVLLVKLETGEGVPERRRFPRLHAALLALLIVVLGLVYLLAGEPGDPEGDDVLPTDPGDELTVVAAEERRSVSGASEPQTGAGEQEHAAQTGSADVVTDNTGGGPGDGSEASSVVDTAGPHESPVEPSESAAPGEPQSESAKDQIAASSSSESDGTPAVEVVSEATEEPESPSADLPASQTSSPVAAEPASAIGLPAGVRDSRWLLAQNPDYFTLQLVTVSSAESASTFVSRQREPAEFTVYQLARDGRILHVVLFGLFSSRTAAEAAVDNLPDEVGRVQPWIRSVGQVQAAARLSTRH